VNEAIELATNVLIKPFEGYAKRLPNGDCCAYPDPATGGDPWTIGYGSTGRDIRQYTVWTKEQAEDALQEHVRYFTSGLVKLSPSLLQATPRRFAAVISWAYNCGLGNYRISTFKKRIDASNWEGAAIECVKWNKAAGRVLPGLTRRRQAEALMMR
jgi:GH24 family phage-related lysozyme (muramidase)